MRRPYRPPSIATVVEFYHQEFDHYFVTADPKEIADLDTGVHTGWTRTGYRFSVIKGGSTHAGTSSVCRFWNENDSHFYSAKVAECDDVKVKFPDTWHFEATEVFRAFVVDPSTGVCPADTTATYRMYNKKRNHRYTTQLSVYVHMLAKGYQPEGDGNPALPIAFCTPSGGDVVPPLPAHGPELHGHREQRRAPAGHDAAAERDVHQQSHDLHVDRLHEHPGELQRHQVDGWRRGLYVVRGESRGAGRGRDDQHRLGWRRWWRRRWRRPASHLHDCGQRVEAGDQLDAHVDR